MLAHAAIPFTAVTLGVTAGCSGDVLTAPDQFAIRKAVLDQPVTANALLRTTPIFFKQTATATIGREGGTLGLSEAGIEVVVPPGALVRPTRVSVTAIPGFLVAYEFQPHGTVFRTPLVVTQKLTNTLWMSDFDFFSSLLGLSSGTSLEAGYFADATQLDQTNGTAQVNEVLPVVVDDTAQTATFNVSHFSGYVIATGRDTK